MEKATMDSLTTFYVGHYHVRVTGALKMIYHLSNDLISDGLVVAYFYWQKEERMELGTAVRNRRPTVQMHCPYY